MPPGPSDGREGKDRKESQFTAALSIRPVEYGIMSRSSKFLSLGKYRKKIKNSRAYKMEATAAFKRALEKRYGSLGAASPVIRIDPITGKVIEIINAGLKSD